MGVKFNREYADIIQDLSRALEQMEECNELFEMSDAEWKELSSEERSECLRTLADDVFYGLGAEPFIEIGENMITYHKEDHTIRVSIPGQDLRVIALI